MQPGTAWKLFTKAMRPDDALAQVNLSGNTALAKIALSLVAVMA